MSEDGSLLPQPRPPYFPPRDEAQRMADEISAFTARYPHMWTWVHSRLSNAVDALRWEIDNGYVGDQFG